MSEKSRRIAMPISGQLARVIAKWEGANATLAQTPRSTELEKPLNDRALLGDDLCLPDQRHGHEAQHHCAYREHDSHIVLAGWNSKPVDQPSHGPGSPDTRCARHNRRTRGPR